MEIKRSECQLVANVASLPCVHVALANPGSILSSRFPPLSRHYRMPKLFGALVLVGLALACLASWVLESYDTSWHPKRSVRQFNAGDGEEASRTCLPPYPGGELDNIFWFVQVSGSSC